MERKRIWIEGESWTVDGSDGISHEEMISRLLGINRMDDLVNMSSDSMENTTTISTGHWEIESDEDYARRKDNEEKWKKNKSNMVVISTGEYDMLREKAGRYDDLCK